MISMKMKDGGEAFANRIGIYSRRNVGHFPRMDFDILNNNELHKYIRKFDIIKHPDNDEKLIRFSTLCVLLLSKLVGNSIQIQLDWYDYSKMRYITPKELIRNSIMLPIKGEDFGEYIYLPNTYLERINAITN